MPFGSGKAPGLGDLPGGFRFRDSGSRFLLQARFFGCKCRLQFSDFVTTFGNTRSQRDHFAAQFDEFGILLVGAGLGRRKAPGFVGFPGIFRLTKLGHKLLLPAGPFCGRCRLRGSEPICR